MIHNRKESFSVLVTQASHQHSLCASGPGAHAYRRSMPASAKVCHHPHCCGPLHAHKHCLTATPASLLTQPLRILPLFTERVMTVAKLLHVPEKPEFLQFHVKGLRRNRLAERPTPSCHSTYARLAHPALASHRNDGCALGLSHVRWGLSCRSSLRLHLDVPRRCEGVRPVLQQVRRRAEGILRQLVLRTCACKVQPLSGSTVAMCRAVAHEERSNLHDCRWLSPVKVRSRKALNDSSHVLACGIRWSDHAVQLRAPRSS